MAKAAERKTEGKEVKAKDNLVPIVLDTLKVGTLRVTIVGTTPLIMENWDVKIRQQLANKHIGAETDVIQSARDPKAEAEAKLYRTSKGKYAMPASGIKKAMVTACTSTNKKIRKTFLLQALHIIGAEGNLVEVDSPGYRVQEDMGRGSARRRRRGRSGGRCSTSGPRRFWFGTTKRSSRLR